MKNKAILSIAAAAAVMLAAGTAQAAPGGGVLGLLHDEASRAQSEIESVHWRRHHRCHWVKRCYRHRWHYHCRWVRHCHHGW
jgi:hypothetical protein